MPQPASAIPFCYGHENDAAARGLPVFFSFSTAASQPAVQTYKHSAADVGLGTVQSVFIDNSQSPAQTTIILGASRQTLVIAPYSQGFYRLLSSTLDIDVTIVNYGGVLTAPFAVGMNFLNVDGDAGSWSSQPVGGLQGTPYAASSSGSTAAAALSLTMNTVAGRRSFITSTTICVGGCTAGAIVNANIIGADTGLGYGATLNYAVSSPVGANNGGTPLALTFSPALPIYPGTSATIYLPITGAGNTLCSISVTGFYL